MPLPAGIKWPTITFSFKPSSLSTWPLIAASVKTFVVSWKLAADINDSEESAAFVIMEILLIFLNADTFFCL